MKSISEGFEDAEMEKIEGLKKELRMSWHDFIIELVEQYNKKQ